MAKTKEELQAEKEEKELEKAIANEEAEKRHKKEELQAEKEEKELEKAIANEEAEKRHKKEYKVCVTGFYKLGKMFRAGEKISSHQYKDYVDEWLKAGYIK